MTTQERFQRAADTASAPLRPPRARDLELYWLGVALWVLWIAALVLTGCAAHQRAVRAKTMLHCEFIPDDRNPVQVICPDGYFTRH